MNRQLKTIVPAATLIALIGCSTKTPVIAHVPLVCLGQPHIPERIELTQEEGEAIPPKAVNKLEEKISILRTRINKQCELTEDHNSNFLP